MKKKDMVKVISDRLSRSPGVEFEIFFSQKKVLSIGIKDSQIDHFCSSREIGLALRVLMKGRLGFAYLFGPTTESLLLLTDRAIALAGQADKDPVSDFLSAGGSDIPDLELFDKNLATISEKDKVNHAREMEHTALKTDPRIKKVRKAEYEEVTHYVSLTNSSGLDLEKEGTRITMSLIVLAEENGSSEMGWEFGSARFYTDLDPITIGLSAAKRGLEMLGSRQISTRACPVVLENRTVVDLLGVWSSSFFGENVYKGKSFLKDKINQIISSPKIELTDDGLYPRGMGSAPFDDEGTSQRKTILIKEGKLLTYLFDRYWSKKTGSQLTGNAVRAQISSPPSTSVSNFFIAPGSLSFEKLLITMDQGFLINELMGVHMADPVSGEFSLGASGMWVEKGEPVFPVKGVTISGTIYDLFSGVQELGNDLRFLGRIGGPTLLVKEIIVSGL
jgi:PmbA protein